MSHSYQDNVLNIAEDPFDVIEQAMASGGPHVDQLQAAKHRLGDIADASREVHRDDIFALAVLMAQLVDVVSLSNIADEEQAATDAEPICQFVADGAATLRAAFLDQDSACDDLERIVADANQRWGNWLDPIDMSEAVNALETWPCCASEDDDRQTEDEQQNVDTRQVDLILSAISQPAGAIDEPSDDHSGQSATPPEPRKAPAIESELLEAYLDDANRGLATIESAFLAFEQNPRNHQPIEQVCRELHTLKGASASVGLTDLASLLHDIEETLQGNDEAQHGPADVDPILRSIDAVRQQIDVLSAPCRETGAIALEEIPVSPVTKGFGDTGVESEETIRVKSSDLDRLMDMLAELIMLRNRRDATVDKLQSFNESLMRCQSQLRLEPAPAAHRQSTQRAQRSAVETSHTNPLEEIAHEMRAIYRGQRELCRRVSDENDSISHFIRQFRQAVVNLRRVPISGLFRRLQRVARDAARAESKQIQIQFRGETARLERSHQERLYEPLLHIIRNAVSHGIEPESHRTAAGKEAIGTITLEAQCETHLVRVDVYDDGRGLDYDALRRRGMQRGLIPPDRLPSDEELAQLIFHPGFSTRSAASEISGRGVGMDVVSAALDRMRGWVEVQSTPGHGTRVRLSIPLRSGIEHAMVFRAAGQLFAVPLHCIERVGTDRTVLRDADSQKEFFAMPLSQLVGLNDRDAAPPATRLVIRQKTSLQHSTPSRDEQRLVLLIDDLVGPEEMVVRPLPPLLRHHPLLSGATLAGTGEIILILEGRRLIELGTTQAVNHGTDLHNVLQTPTAEEQR